MISESSESCEISESSESSESNQSDESLLRAFEAGLVELDASAALRDDLPRFFARHGVPAELRASLPAHTAERIAVYRGMVHVRLRDLIAEYLPKVTARLGRPRLRLEVARFIAEVAPRTPYFRAIPGEFVAWASTSWPLHLELPPYLLALASYEWLESELEDACAGGEPPSGLPLALDRPVHLDGTTTLRRYSWAVHKATDTHDPPLADTALLVYRDPLTFRVRSLELTPRAAAVCTRLLAGEPLQAALLGTCDELGLTDRDEFLAAMAEFFADLAERQVLLGAR